WRDCSGWERRCGAPLQANVVRPLVIDTIWLLPEWYHPFSKMSVFRNNHSFQTAGLLIRLDPDARESLQQQIYTAARQAILDGILTPCSRLPSSRTLADDLRVSRTTTLLAYEQLAAEGYLAARHGSGTYVAQELPDDLPRQAPPRRAARAKH